MTAQAGLHSLPAELRGAVAAEPGHVLVRADLGQIEPRVLAAVSGDPALAAATADDDLYTPVAAAARLRPADRQGRGAGGDVRPDLGRGRRRAHGDAADLPGRDARTCGRPRTPAGPPDRSGRTAGGWSSRGAIAPRPARTRRPDAAGAHRGAVAAQGRYVRNALVQGAAAELFKAWAAAVRAELLGTGAAIVLCLHDELLVHTPAAQADEVAALLHRALDETAARWFPADPPVRFVADVAVVTRWSDAKS